MLVFRLISGCIRNGQFEGMFSSFEPFFIEFVGNDRFAFHFEQDVLSVYLSSVGLYAAQVIGQAENKCLLADPCVGAQRGDRRCFEILPDRIIAKFFDRAVDPAVPVSTADPGLTSFLSADDTILLLVFQRVDS